MPKIEIATWRSYANVIATGGRSLGGPIGGRFHSVAQEYILTRKRLAGRYDGMAMVYQSNPPLIPSLLTDTICRSFISQVPLIVIAFILVAWGLENSLSEDSKPQDPRKVVASSKLGRIDFLGAILISSTIVSLLLAVDISGQGKPWTSPLVLSLVTTCLVLGTVFLVFEANYAREPIFPPRLLLKRDVATAYSISSLQTAAQLAVCAPCLQLIL